MKFLYDSDLVNDRETALELEWLDTNGTGGYASSTIFNCHTRKYHGLLVANLPPPANGRHVLLSKFEESIVNSDGEYALSLNKYVNDPEFEHRNSFLRRFEQDLFPSWEYDWGSGRLLVELLMPYRVDCVILRYTLLDCPAAKLRLTPLLAYRRNHATAAAHEYVNSVSQQKDGKILLQPYEGMPQLILASSPRSGTWTSDFYWHTDIAYDMEKERGYDHSEDLISPGTLELGLHEDQPCFLAVAAGQAIEDIETVWEEEVARRNSRRKLQERDLALTGFSPQENDIIKQLAVAADQFLIWVPPARHSIIAGYHWFDDWGRDALISLPGLTFCQGNLEDGFDVLCTFARFEDNGLIPNYIGMEGRPAYNSLDASFWFFWTVQQYLKKGGSVQKVRAELWPVMKRIINRIYRGEAPDVEVTESGLLQAGHEKISLTWMDAIVDGVPVTPRTGMAVDINALWYNALSFASELATEFNDTEFTPPYDLTKLKEKFSAVFWFEDIGYLADTVDSDGPDRSLRPNQLLAVALPYMVATPDQARSIVAMVEKALLTPVGLRTLAPDSPFYHGRYEGSQAERDNSYHQGTVWPWLLGFFGEAYLKTSANKSEACTFLLKNLSYWYKHLHEAGIGQISEVFDGDPPHRSNGCIAQAWSVAEILRLYSLIQETER